MYCYHENDVTNIIVGPSCNIHIIQLQNNTKDDHAIVYGSSPKAGQEVHE